MIPTVKYHIKEIEFHFLDFCTLHDATNSGRRAVTSVIVRATDKL